MQGTIVVYNKIYMYTIYIQYCTLQYVYVVDTINIQYMFENELIV